ncbi:putative T7SS-secreted protein [Prauserella cavernicola]|uniref:Putative T7SS secretion signal domain-containing protein n=1 Tax=Prauserella cavernicola TaxID=2800127 RepID=A0A934V361_9PSEU|nr:hypothetical protein [Prauserella cavernicola]MBK1783279.1 hypothetical protein [Prauserella cavernicola]
MAAQLGHTHDPRELIPGQPESIADDLRQLVGNIEQVTGIGELLGGLDPVNWVGEASNAFRDAFGTEPPKWGRLVDSVAHGGQTLAGFADVLTWGQSEAQRAIELYTQARAVSRAAAAEHQAQAAQAPGVVLAPFQDPGRAAAAEAQAILDNARQRVDGVGADIAARLGLESDGQGGYSRAVEREVGSERRREGEWGSQGELLGNRVAGLLESLGIELPTASWEGSAEAKVAGGELGGEFDGGWATGEGTLGGSVLGAGAQANGSVDPLGARGGASAEAYLAKGNAEGSLDLGGAATVAGSAEGYVGAEASARGDLGWTGVDVGADAFVGAKAAGEASAEIAGVTAGATGEAWAGVGAEASAEFGMGEDGKFHIGASAGVGLGYGAKLGGEIAIDPAAVAGTVSGVANDIGELAGGWF